MIAIIYRCCGAETNGDCRPDRPEWFDKRNCFNSIYRQVRNDDRFSMRIIYDGDTLSNYIAQFGLPIFTIRNKSNEASFKTQLDYAEKLNAEYTYFLEDDYLHRSGAVDALLDGFGRGGLFSLYDSPDRYSRTDDIPYPARVERGKICHWRTAESTTCTWAADRATIKQALPLAKECGLEDRLFFRRAQQELGLQLWTALPGFSAHIVKGEMSPCISWKSVNDECSI